MKLRYIFPMALALSAVPAQALPLSEIVTALESQYDIHFIDEIEWHNDGYWDVEFFTRDGAKVDLKIDPVTGETHSEA